MPCVVPFCYLYKYTIQFDSARLQSTVNIHKQMQSMIVCVYSIYYSKQLERRYRWLIVLLVYSMVYSFALFLSDQCSIAQRAQHNRVQMCTHANIVGNLIQCKWQAKQKTKNKTHSHKYHDFFFNVCLIARRFSQREYFEFYLFCWVYVCISVEVICM